MQAGICGATDAFRGGDVARVHLQVCQGGGLRCAARCPGCSTHSLLQVMSAARNLNTVFSTVNTFVKIFSSPLATGAGGAGGSTVRFRVDRVDEFARPLRRRLRKRFF